LISIGLLLTVSLKGPSGPDDIPYTRSNTQSLGILERALRAGRHPLLVTLTATWISLKGPSQQSEYLTGITVSLKGPSEPVEASNT
jgi:hypothetical protein